MTYISILFLFFAFGHPTFTPANNTNNTNPYEAGVILTFDDKYVDEWFAADSVFSACKWKATFFIMHFDKLSAQQKTKLLALQAKGHEIGFHGDRHRSALPYIKEKGLAAYLQDEFTTIPLMQEMGFKITSFAYPSGSRDNATDSALATKFSMLRGVASATSVNDGITGFYDGTPLVNAIGMEYQYKYFSDAVLINLLDEARKQNKILVFYGHRLVRNPDTTKHEVAYSTVQTICHYVAKHHMRFYTMNDLAKIKSN